MGYIARERQTVYLYPRGDCKYAAEISIGTPPITGVVRLVDVANYPVDVLYSQTDRDDHCLHQTKHCTNTAELLSALNWCGQCRYTIEQVWNFNLKQTESATLRQMFRNANRYRLAHQKEDASNA